MALRAINPATEELLLEVPELLDEQLAEKLGLAERMFAVWRETSFEERAKLFKNLGELFRKKGKALGKLASLEMGKPFAQAIAEVEKCATVCDYYAENAKEFLAPEYIQSDASESYARFDPIGVVLAIMPWNFPFWQVMRFAAPALMAGNVGVLKHASNVPQCAQALEDIFREAGFPEGVFLNLAIGSSKVEQVIRHPAVWGVALTGSEYAGSKVAALAGSLIKKTVLELGGSDPFIVLADADIAVAAKIAAKARLQNNGQSCIAAKRFIVVEEVYDEFLSAFTKEVESYVVGDPLDEKTTLGPLVNAAGREDIERQVQESVEKGARIVSGGKRIGEKGFFYAATILADVAPGMPAYHEELFGPVASVIRVRDAEEAVRVANDTPFGLGGSVWTKNTEVAKSLAVKIRSGSVFVNGLVKSDARLPFGGTGISGYGRELSSYGLREFVHVKTVWVA
jgi:succinate-semialdehyde dehydrogenase/glutarate-semialdehyde dehydrogenase